jgi:hypothetical protein
MNVAGGLGKLWIGAALLVFVDRQRCTLARTNPLCG